ncbi:MAG: glycoside hydrolase family 3 C-terminal domain-containing protein [Bacteroidota bacterium]
MNKKFNHLLIIISFLGFIIGCDSGTKNEATDKPENMDTESKIASLMSDMTIEEKVALIHASSPFTSGGVERLGIPELVMSDGPHGVRHEHGRDWQKDENVYDSSTYLPVGTALAATWNRDLGYQFGTVLGSEANYRGKDIILGPGMNIIRSPLNGRNFEYMTEDPYLNAEMAVGYIKGVQEQGVAACAKHYIANTYEYEREYVNVEMSDRALREIYLPAYKASVQRGEVLTVMAAYNKFRGTYCAHSKLLLDDILKAEYGFEGLVVSDWNAVKNTMEAVNVGIDIEMGTDLEQMRTGKPDYNKFFMADTVISLVKAGTVQESVVDEKVKRILRVMHKIDKFGERQPGAYNTKEHQQIARKIAEEAIVLLKNEGTLPLQKDGIKKLAVVGANATHKHAGGGGSSQVKAFYEITPLAGLQNMLGDQVEINYAPGYEIKKDAALNTSLIEEAVKAVQGADAAIYIGGWIHGYTDEWNDNAYDAENVDKPDMQLPFGQNELIKAVLKANPNTVIVMMGGGPMDMRFWRDDAKSIVQAWYPGMEGGNVIAEVIFGDINPSGKLPMTFPERLEDSPAHALSSYPNENLLINHTEGIYVGYRYFDTQNVTPAFAFGHGLSYTSFEYSDLSVTKDGEAVKVSVKVTNTGDKAGKEVIQLYVKDAESSLERPEKELKGFDKVALEPGASQVVNFELNKDAFSYFDDTKGEWVLEPGDFSIMVGGSSRDIRVTGDLAW